MGYTLPWGHVGEGQKDKKTRLDAKKEKKGGCFKEKIVGNRATKETLSPDVTGTLLSGLRRTTLSTVYCI